MYLKDTDRLESFLDLLLVARPPGSEQAAEVFLPDNMKSSCFKIVFKVREAIAGILEEMGWQVGFKDQCVKFTL